MFLLSVICALDAENGDFLRNLIDKHSDKLYSVAYQYMKNHHDAKDVVQDVFISAYKNIEIFYDLQRDEAASLLVKYTRNKAIDHLRKKKRRPDTIPLTYFEEGEERVYEVHDFAENPERRMLEKEKEERLISFIEALPIPQREVLEMKYKFGMTNKEIADALSLSETAVSSRINRAKISVLEFLKGEENE
ncbi:MAG: sigma-70 family RNA polymerase sigma factor [Clostridia bacterium]|nr:sigma-70 family RNA polymerase sigma factor [Clostridia bacterium]